MRVHLRKLLLKSIAAVAALAVPAAAMEEHRMGGMPGMPAEMLAPTEQDPHHRYDHDDAAQADELRVFAFGQRAPETQVTRVLDLEIDDSMSDSDWKPRVQRGEIVRLVVRNRGQTPHEVRIGDPQYQRDHAGMLRRMPGQSHRDQNALVVPPAQTRSIIWRFGDAPVVQLACHTPDGSAVAVLATVLVAP